jgi:4-hydroxybenzoate polyprenyltransferase
MKKASVLRVIALIKEFALKLINILKLFRPSHYIKNFFIFFPLIFAMKITDTELLSNAFIAFIAFSLTASAIYTFNDYHDIEEDRQHPRKKERSLASGVISKSQAIIFMSILFVLGFALMALISFKAAGILTVYVIMNIAYSLSLKHISIVDINIIAIGFVMRLFIGSVVTGIHLSKWIIIMTFLLALFMALAKRRDDVLIFLDTGKIIRKASDGYNLPFIDTAMAIMASVVIVAYTLYTTSLEMEAKFNSEYLYLTTFFCILGIMRYLKITFVYKYSDSPLKVFLKDKFMQITILAWIVSFILIIYL